MPNVTSFDQRIVRYEDIHNVQADHFSALVDAVAAQDCYRILDCGCGYGAVTREILSRTQDQRRRNGYLIAIDLVDESRTQLDRAREELKPWSDDPLVKLDFLHGSFPEDFNNFKWHRRYDVVAAKMVLHEVAREKQPDFVDGLYACLKDNGRLILWDLFLAPETAAFFRETISAKDKLAKFETLVKRRCFLSETEFIAILNESRFSFCKYIKHIDHKVETRKRLQPEFGGREDLLEQWHESIRAMATAASSSLLQTLQYEDDTEHGTIRFKVKKAIFSCQRAEHLNLSLKPFTPGEVTIGSPTDRTRIYPSVVEQSFADGKLSRVLGCRTGLIRASLLTRVYGGGRQLYKEGLDYLYNADPASSNKQLDAYLAHLTWLCYGSGTSLRSRNIRSISYALSEAFRNVSTAAWMTVELTDECALEISMGTTKGVEGKAVVSVPRHAKAFFENVINVLKRSDVFRSEPLRGDRSISRLMASTGKSLDATANDLALNLARTWESTFERLASTKIEVSYLIENNYLPSFLNESKEVLFPLIEFLAFSNNRTLHYLLPPRLTTKEDGRLDEGVFILNTHAPLVDAAFLDLLALVAGLWSGLGALEAETTGRQAQEEHEAAERSRAVAGFTHQVGHVLDEKSGVPPFRQFANWITTHGGIITAAIQGTEDLGLRAAQVRYASILPTVFAATIERLEPVKQQERMWKTTATVDDLIKDVWNSLVLPCAKAAGSANPEFGAYGREPELEWSNNCGVTFVPKNDLVQAILFEILWNACRHGSFDGNPPGKALIRADVQPVAAMAELLVTNPAKQGMTVGEDCCRHLRAFVDTLKSWKNAAKADLFDISFLIEGDTWVTRFTLPVKERTDGSKLYG